MNTNRDGADHSAERPHAVADAHQDGGVAGRDVEVVDVEPGDGEPGAADGEDEGDDGRHPRVGVAHHDEEQSLAAEPAAVEHLA